MSPVTVYSLPPHWDQVKLAETLEEEPPLGRMGPSKSTSTTFDARSLNLVRNFLKSTSASGSGPVTPPLALLALTALLEPDLLDIVATSKDEAGSCLWCLSHRETCSVESDGSPQKKKF